MKLSGKQKYLSLSIIHSYSWSEWVIYRMYRRRCQPVFILTLFLIFDTLKIPKASPCWLQKGRMYNRVNKKLNIDCEKRYTESETRINHLLLFTSKVQVSIFKIFTICASFTFKLLDQPELPCIYVKISPYKPSFP